MFEYDPQAHGVLIMLDGAAKSTPAHGVIHGPDGYHIWNSDDTQVAIGYNQAQVFDRLREQGLVRDHRFHPHNGKALPGTAESVPQRLTEAGEYVLAAWTRQHYGTGGLEPRDVAVVVFLRVPSVDSRDANNRAEAAVSHTLGLVGGGGQPVLSWEHLGRAVSEEERVAVHGVLSLDQAVWDRAVEIKPSALPYRLT